MTIIRENPAPRNKEEGGFDPFLLDLDGVSFIEANAGCGKTRSLTDLYLRLITQGGLAPRNIVVLSFTDAATAELKERLRQRLKEARRAFEDKKGQDSFLAALLEATKPSATSALRAIIEALGSFDEAAVYTIHGFCLRLLTDFSYETGGFAAWETVGVGHDLTRDLLHDHYRRLFYCQYPELTAFSRAKGRQLKSLEILVRKVIENPSLRILPPPWGMTEKETGKAVLAFREAYTRFCSDWLRHREGAHELLTCSRLHASYYSPPKLKEIFAETDYFLSLSEPVFPLPDHFIRLTETFLAEKTLKGKIPPQGEIFSSAGALFAAAQSLEAACGRFLHDMTLEILEKMKGELARRRWSSPQLSYSDLLLRVHESLFSPLAQALLPAVRRNYRAVLVDEFQDTDSIQYAIIKKIFVEANLATCFIGDPKQAIYAFRGADVYAYLNAARAPGGKKYLARVNYRSFQGLVGAVNTIFQKSAEPFVNREIRYEPSLSGADRDGLKLLGEGRAPLKLWYLADSSGEGSEGADESPLTLGAAKPRVAAAVAGEIRRLLALASLGQALIGTKALTARDIAILVRKREEALVVMQKLAQVGISSSLETAGSVYHTWEARQMETLLTALTEPGDERWVRSALTTVFFGLGANAIHQMNKTGEIRNQWLPRFQGWAEAAKRNGLRYAMRIMMAEDGKRERILSLEKGLRVLTNTDHLLELLDSARLAEQLSPAGLLSFIRKKIASAPESGRSGEEKEQQLRLADDGHQVRIVTIHKSKGLEYPVVFCPFSWGSLDRKEDLISFHQPDTGLPLAYLGPAGMGEEEREAAEKEALSEECRLLYVALTRAKYRCYLVWGRFRKIDNKSALAHLLHGGITPGREKFIKDLEDLAAGNPEEIEVLPLPEGKTEAGFVLPCPTGEGLVRRRFYLSGDDSWQVTSASHIMAGRTGSLGDELVIDDEEAENLSDEKAPGDPEFLADLPRGGEKSLLETLPGGVQTGILLHDILKNVDFRQAGSQQSRREVERKLDFYGYSPAAAGEIMNILTQTTSASLNGDGLKLSLIGPGDRIDEMPFYFPLRKWEKKSLLALFTPFRSSHPHYLAAGENLSPTPRHGFMKGYVDLVIGRQGRYFLLDWKTNYLGEKKEDYGREKLTGVMVESLYVFQYLIYTLAVHRYLASRIPDYRYEEHFGGVFYLFLRGIDHLSPRGEGIFFDLPPAKLIDELDAYCNK